MYKRVIKCDTCRVGVVKKYRFISDLFFECPEATKCKICITMIGFIKIQSRCREHNSWRWQLIQNISIVLMCENRSVEYLGKTNICYIEFQLRKGSNVKNTFSDIVFFFLRERERDSKIEYSINKRFFLPILFWAAM